MSSFFGSIASNAVTLDGNQSVSGKKRFLNVDNEFDGTMVQPTILALGQTIDPTELSFLAGVSSNIQTQFAGINIVLTGLTALEQALQAIEPAPNATTVKFADTILLEDPLNSGNTLLLSPGEISNLVNINGLPYPQIWNQDTTGNAATATSSTDSTKLPLAGGTMTGELTMDSVPIYISGVSSALNIAYGSLTGTLAVNGLSFTDPDISFSSAFTESSVSLTSSNQTATLTAPLLQFVDNSNLSNFKFQTNTNFFKYDCGASYRIRPHDGQKVNKDDAVIVTWQSPSDYNFFNYEYYLDADGLGGFSFIIIHPGSVSDPTIICGDILMVTRDYGPQNSFSLPKWSAASFILTPTDPAIGYPNNFVWMVSW